MQSENRATIDWNEEFKIIHQFPELAYLHKSDTFLKISDTIVETVHRYCKGKELIMSKKLKWPILSKTIRTSILQQPRKLIALLLTIIIEVVIT